MLKILSAPNEVLLTCLSLSLQGYVRNLHASTTTLKQILEETSSLLRMFWRAALPSTEASAQQLKKVRGHLESKPFGYHNKSWKHYPLLCFFVTSHVHVPVKDIHTNSNRKGFQECTFT